MIITNNSEFVDHILKSEYKEEILKDLDQMAKNVIDSNPGIPERAFTLEAALPIGPDHYRVKIVITQLLNNKLSCTLECVRKLDQDETLDLYQKI